MTATAATAAAPLVAPVVPLPLADPDDLPTALDHDDACARNSLEDGSKCAVIALQLRGLKVAVREVVPLGPARPAGDGECVTETAGSCSLLSCRADRGPTDCVRGRCMCREGHCLDGGVCKKAVVSERGCGKHTGGSCRFLRCAATRGPTRCEGGVCVCDDGLCASSGSCVLPQSTFLAQVVPVDSAHRAFPGPQAKLGTALCFSGGGARSLSIVMGALRALEGLDLMRGVDAISSVSGGTWAAAIYMFAGVSTEELLGAATTPSQLTLSALRQAPAAMGATATADTGAIALRLLAEGIAPERLWVETVGQAFLRPFGLDSNNAFMAADAAAVERIRAANPQLSSSTFLTPRPGRPRAFVMNGALLSPVGYLANREDVVSFQMSPDFTGSPHRPNGRDISYPSPSSDKTLEGVVGGGLIETFAFGGEAPFDGQGGSWRASLSSPALPFTLVDALGISSAAFASTMAAKKFSLSSLVPKASVWPVLDVATSAKTYNLGDGGNVENGGLLAMLQRGVPRIAWWINTDTGLGKSVDFCTLSGTLPIDLVKGQVTSMVYDKFGYGQLAKAFYAHNQVFKTSEFPSLLCDLHRLVSGGKPAVVRRRGLEVLPNTWWGIEAYTIDLVIIYNEHCQDFVSLLPEETRTSVAKGAKGDFKHFPLYHTMFNNVALGVSATALTAAQINLLAAQAEFTVRQNEAVFRDLLGGF